MTWIKLAFASAGVLLCVTVVGTVRLKTVIAATQPAQSETISIPPNYREWVYLTSGLDMTYDQPGSAPLPADHVSVFDNVFVNPEAYRTFVKIGVWPEKTVFVLENRNGERNVSINRAGRTQGAGVTGVELHTKLDNEWAFYARGNDGNEHLIAKPASCYTCHEEHAAVDATFTQFYPTLLPIAKAKHVLSASYMADEAAATGK